MPLHFASLYDGQVVFVWSDCPLDLGTDSSLVTRSLYEVSSILLQHLISMARMMMDSSSENEDGLFLLAAVAL